MSFLSDLQTASSRLRRVRIERDSSAPRLVTELDAISDSYDAAVQHCNIERWLPLLDQHGLTFETVLVPLSTEHANAIVAAYNAAEHASELDVASQTPLHELENYLRLELEKPVQAALDKLGGRCIVKTSSRSPKDAAARTGLLRRILSASLSAAALEDENEMIRVLCKAEGAALRFGSARDVIRAFILSERIWQDMTLALRHVEAFEQNIVIRRWEDIHIDMEFRCFVHARTLTAISQYAYQLYSSMLASALPQAKKTIIKFFETHLGATLVQGGFETCVVDIALVPASWKAWVIEINPFLPSTDPGLFSWEVERGILEGQRHDVQYPVIRICERRKPGSLAMIPKAWRNVLRIAKNELRQQPDLATK